MRIWNAIEIEWRSGGKAIPQARQVLESLQANGIPHIFLTNGGGRSTLRQFCCCSSVDLFTIHMPGCAESVKADAVSRALDMKIDPKQVVLSHTPMRPLAKQYRGVSALPSRSSCNRSDRIAAVQTSQCSSWAPRMSTMWCDSIRYTITTAPLVNREG